jgi:peroxiredoxin
MKYLGLILILLTLFSCKKNNSFIVKGKVLDKESGIVRLNQIGEKAYDAKICELTGGEFYFKGEVGLPEEFFIQYKENYSSRGTDYFTFFVEPGTETEIVLNTENINKSRFKGSKIGSEYYKIKQKIYNELEIKAEKLIPEYEKAQKANDKELLDNIVKKSDSITNEIQKWELRYIWNHPNSYISAKLLYSRQDKLNLDTLQRYFNKLDEHLFESKYYKRLKTFLSLQVGKPFLDFELPDSAGITHRFSSVAKNKVTLIDFWFSSCAPCRKHNRQLKELYETYKSKGFEVVGVSTDKNPSDFIKAIKEDEMTWLNLLDNTNAESVESIYGSNLVPFNILIDQNGLIVYQANDYKNLKIVVDSLMRVK